MRKCQLIPDIRFQTGMRILSQKNHSDGESFCVLGSHDFYGKKAEKPEWGLCQWDSGPCLYRSMVPSEPAEITDGKWRSFAYRPETDTLTYRLDTSAYYQGKPARLGDYWPHLLIERPDFAIADQPEENREFYRCDSEKIVVSFDIRLLDFSEEPHEGDWVRAAQFLLYFYVKGIETDDFCWFGMHLFDNRQALDGIFTAYDGGKADASGKLIYNIGSRYVYGEGPNLWKNGAPAPDGEWIHVELDLVPFLQDMLEVGNKDDYFRAKDLGGFCLNGMNMGWETIGTFDHKMEIRGLRLTSYRK